MLAITNSITPEKLNERFKLHPSLGTGLMDSLKKEQGVETGEQLTRMKHRFYSPQISGINKAILHG